MASHFAEVGTLLKNLYESNICHLLKKEKNDSDPDSYSRLYRTIVLQNIDRKIITVVLKNRLSKDLRSIIHSDRTGFIPVLLF